MSIFQSTVVTKHLKGQNSEIITAKWNIYKDHFLNTTIQENIRNSNEEQYQGGFIIDLFVNVLGYTKNPSPNFNITTEYKNIKDSKKADGAIIINEVVKAVIELKGTNTTDLSKVESQAFGYKNNQPQCTYIITSNFEKLRFYIDNAIDHIEFNLFTLTEEEFKLLYLCLAYENIEKDIPKKIKEESVSQEDAITKKLYNDYSLFKRELHKNLVKLNRQFDALTLFKKSQKLLDRFLFLFFAEDRLLLPPNSVRLVLSDWRDLQERDVDVTLYKRFKKYFGYLNTGFKGKRYDVFAYNGGLFKPDELLDSIIIDDELLYKHTLTLSEYDFESEVDVNILGHIFENSLTEIEEVQAELEGQVSDKTKSKRKTDGVFYTPKYITKYIVENTVGKLCEEKKAEFDITDDNYQPAKQRSRKRLQNLQDYRDWLLQITICDPACGSGAFLNQALDFLIKEHLYIDELSAKYNKDALVLSDVEIGILENNLFGVDINQESVDIAKLSLWLRTATPNRKLNDLSNNIKCGNSLIDDPEVAGEKAFNWQQEFPQIFAKGGFDVVIGNPPYVSYQSNILSEQDLNYFEKTFNTSFKIFDLYGLFVEKANGLIKEGGNFSFIIPSPMLMNDSFKFLREFIVSNYHINEFVICSDGVFEGAVVPTIIFNFSKKDLIKKTIKILRANDKDIYLEREFDYMFFVRNPKEGFNTSLSQDVFKLLQKIQIESVLLGDILEIRESIKTGNDKLFISNDKLNNDYYPLVTGKDVSRYSIKQNRYLLFDENKLSRPTKMEYYLENKLFIRRVGKDIECVLDKNNYLSTHVLYIGRQKDKDFDLGYFLALLNSNFINKIYKFKFPPKGKVFPEIRIGNLRELPIKAINIEKQMEFSNMADKLTDLRIKINKTSEDLTNLLKRRFGLLTVSKKLREWYFLNYDDFIKELSKKKIKLTLTEENEWEQYFIDNKAKALKYNFLFDEIENNLEQAIFKLYDLDSVEIELFE